MLATLALRLLLAPLEVRSSRMVLVEPTLSRLVLTARLVASFRKTAATPRSLTIAPRFRPRRQPDRPSRKSTLKRARHRAVTSRLPLPGPSASGMLIRWAMATLRLPAATACRCRPTLAVPLRRYPVRFATVSRLSPPVPKPLSLFRKSVKMVCAPATPSKELPRGPAERQP